MARARTLVPSFFTDERVVSVSAYARLLFQGLWTEADREGRLEDKPLVLKMRLFPADAVDVSALLVELVEAGLINRYEAQGRAYLLVPNFKEHQHVHPKEAPSKLPPPPWLTNEAREKPSSMAPKVNPEGKARENTPCMTENPGSKPHAEGGNPSDVQALGSSRPSSLHALVPSVGIEAPEVRRPEDKNSQWVDHSKAFVEWAKGQWHTLKDPGTKVEAWALGFFTKYQPSNPELIRVAFAKFIVWCHQSGKTVGWGLWLCDDVWEPRWAEVRADAQARGAA